MVKMGKRLNILAIGAHPDDIELGCGGTLRRHVENGDNVYGLILTRGERGRHLPEGRECIRSAKVIGFKDITLLKFEDTKLRDDGELVSAIRSQIKECNASVIYGHTLHDYHQDHRYASLATQSASNLGEISEVLLFECPSTNNEFDPHYFRIITDHLPVKLRALRKYKSQFQRDDSILNIDWIRGRGLSWGSKIKLRNQKSKIVYAEAFEVNHIIHY